MSIGVSGGANIGGGDNHAQLTNLDYANAGHTGFMSSANYLAPQTTFNIKSDGSGDFNTLNEAVSFLSGKWSTGQIKIKLDEGTFNHSENVSFYGGNLFSIPMLLIEGKGANNTILNFTNPSNATHIISVDNTSYVRFKDMTIKAANGDTTTDYRGVAARENSIVSLHNVTVDGCNYAINSTRSANIILIGGITVKNCNLGIGCEGGELTGNWGVATTFNTVTTAFYVYGGGVIRIPFPTYSATSVTNKTSQTIGTATASGWITGFSS